MKKKSPLLLILLVAFLSLISMFGGGVFSDPLLPSENLSSPSETPADTIPDGNQGDQDKIDDPNIADDGNKDKTEYVVTYKTFDDCFKDLEISKSTITESDLTGDGSAYSPYVVHSTNGFLYLMNNKISGINLENKMVELACDVYLNDETFDETGAPSGGNGVVYSYIFTHGTAIGMSFDGKGHSIKGMYFNDSEVQFFALFGTKTLNKIKNLIIEDFYISGNSYISPLAYSCVSIENCVSRKGFVVASSYNATGLVITAREAINCQNYSNISGTSRIGGIMAPSGASASVLIVKCANYGEITATISHAGGILGTYSVDHNIYDCINYGNVNAPIYAGGMSVGSYNSFLYIQDCINYGMISTTSSDQYCGGIIGIVTSPTTIVNCKNFGKINVEKASSCGNFIGGIAVWSYDLEINLVISNCNTEFDYLKTGCPFLVGVISASTLNLNIQNCVFNFINMNKDSALFYFMNLGKLSIENTKINIQCDPSISYKLVLNTNNKPVDLHIKNMIINTDANLAGFFSTTIPNENIQSVIAISSYVNSFCKRYYGSDFSDFHISWKTGKIGLNAVDGVGLYQGELSKEQLDKLGFVNVSV